MWRMETYLDADLASVVVDDVHNALQSRNELVVPNAQATRKKGNHKHRQGMMYLLEILPSKSTAVASWMMQPNPS